MANTFKVNDEVLVTSGALCRIAGRVIRVSRYTEALTVELTESFKCYRVGDTVIVYACDLEPKPE